MSVQTAFIYFQALIEIEIYAIHSLAWWVYMDAKDEGQDRRLVLSDFLYSVIGYLDSTKNFYDPFKMKPGCNPTLIA